MKIGWETVKISSSKNRWFYTFNMDLLLNLERKKDGSNISLLTSYFGLGSRTESTMGFHSGKWRTKYRNTGMSLILGIFVYLPPIVKLKGVAQLKTKQRKNEGFFCLKSYFLRQNTDNSGYNGIQFRKCSICNFKSTFLKYFKPLHIFFANFDAILRIKFLRNRLGYADTWLQ